MFDGIAVLIWQNTQDATEKFPRHRPKPMARPTRPGGHVADGATVPMGVGVAQVTTVGRLMAMREAAAKRWRARQQHQKGE